MNVGDKLLFVQMKTPQTPVCGVFKKVVGVSDGRFKINHPIVWPNGTMQEWFSLLDEGSLFFRQTPTEREFVQALSQLQRALRRLA